MRPTDDIVGSRIVALRPLNKGELRAEGWTEDHGAVVALELDHPDGIVLYASRDPEGNGPGALFGMDKCHTAFTLACKEQGR